MFFSSKKFLASPSQLIVHSSRVRTPQRHNSESVLFIKPPDDGGQSINSTNLINNNNQAVSTSSLDAILDETMRTQVGSVGPNDRSSRRNNNRLFPISTYTEPHTGSQTQLDQIK